jgi:hypothetical protein
LCGKSCFLISRLWRDISLAGLIAKFGDAASIWLGLVTLGVHSGGRSFKVSAKPSSGYSDLPGWPA